MIHCLDEQCWKQDKCLLGCQLEIPALKSIGTVVSEQLQQTWKPMPGKSHTKREAHEHH